jgi:poly[(R)-3-hydroxyalkanoate] polymerase subunit PhaC
VNALERLVRSPIAALELANIVLTERDAPTGVSPKDPVWTYRTTTLWRYRSDRRTYSVPIVLVFALINRPDVFDLRPGHSFVEFLLDQGFDVFLLDWGEPDEADEELGLDHYVCDQIPWALREVQRVTGEEEATLLGWCIGGTLTLMHCALEPRSPVRNLVLLTTPVDTRGSLYTNWVGRDSFDVDRVAEVYGAVPGRTIDWANKLMRPLGTWTTYRKLWQQVLDGTARPDAHQAMARWIADNPPFPGRAFREWITWMYKENRLVRGVMRLRGRRVDLAAVEQSLLVVTAGADHIAPRQGTLAVLEQVGSEDVTHLDRAGGHIGLMAGSKARNEIWPDIAEWLAERSDR